MEEKSTNSNSNSGVFLNGKAQAIELLQHLSTSEKKQILQHIKVKNANLARDLQRESLSFEQQIAELSDQQLSTLMAKVQPQIFGLALKGLGPDVQRKILRLAPRQYAEEAFSYLQAKLSNEKRDVQRAQQKLLNVYFVSC